MNLTVTLTGLDDELDRIVAGVREGMAGGVEQAAELVAEEARANHTFQNRTGDLQASIHVEANPHDHPDAPSAFVVASEDYAEYVDAKLPFLEPALERTAAAQDAAVEAAIESALTTRR